MDPAFFAAWLAVVLPAEIGLWWVVARSDGWRTAVVVVSVVSGIAALAGVANYAVVAGGAT